MKPSKAGPFNPARVAENFPASDPFDQWCDELQILAYAMTRAGFLQDMRRLPEAERNQFLADLRTLQAKLVEVLDADRIARAFTSKQPGEREH